MLTPSSRRSFLGVAATAGLVLAEVTGRPRPAESSAPVDDILVAGTFKVDIQGCGGSTATPDAIEIEDLTIDARETTSGLDVEFRTFAPGNVHVGAVTITIPDDRQCNGLGPWLTDAAAGKIVRKNVSVILFGEDGSEARRWNLLACAPEKLASAQSAVRCEGAPAPLAVAVRPLRVELVPATPEESEPLQPAACGGRILPRRLARRLRRKGQPWAVQVTDAKTGETSSWSGLSEFVPTLPVTIDLTAAGNGRPGLKSIDEITLRGPMTVQRRQWVQQCVSAAAAGQSRRLHVTIVKITKEGSDGKRYTYTNCFPTRHAFPRLSADGTGNLYEEVSLKPERLEIT